MAVALRFFALRKNHAPTPDNRAPTTIAVPRPAFEPVLRPADCEDAGEIDAMPAWEEVDGVDAALVVEEFIVGGGPLTDVGNADSALVEDLDVDAELLANDDGLDATLVEELGIDVGMLEVDVRL